jgi:hypothetical protein
MTVLHDIGDAVRAAEVRCRRIGERTVAVDDNSPIVGAGGLDGQITAVIGLVIGENGDCYSSVFVRERTIVDGDRRRNWRDRLSQLDWKWQKGPTERRLCIRGSSRSPPDGSCCPNSGASLKGVNHR